MACTVYTAKVLSVSAIVHLGQGSNGTGVARHAVRRMALPAGPSLSRARARRTTTEGREGDAYQWQA